jgi:toluene monooxygenase system protein E
MSTAHKTYWHFNEQRRIPSEYELVTTKLLYYGERGFEVLVPLAAWYEKHQRGSQLSLSDWEQFKDPRETTYARYVALQQKQEVFVDGVFHSMQKSNHDVRLSDAWVEKLLAALLPLRYPLHGLQMAMSYVAHMAPGGRIVVAGLFQAADDLRRIQRIAERLAMLRKARKQPLGNGRSIWQEQPSWQPLRRAVERLLTTYDWGEALVALNVCLKPLFDELWVAQFADWAKANGDYPTSEIFLSLWEDCAWHREWTAALVRLLVMDESNQRALRGWMDAWLPVSAEALSALHPLFGDQGPKRIEACHAAWDAWARTLSLKGSRDG